MDNTILTILVITNMIWSFLLFLKALNVDKRHGILSTYMMYQNQINKSILDNERGIITAINKINRLIGVEDVYSRCGNTNLCDIIRSIVDNDDKPSNDGEGGKEED